MKVNFFMRNRADRSLDQFSNYWRENHGPFAMSGRTDRLGMRRYVQNHLTVTPLAEPLARLVGSATLPFEGICQIWFDSEEAVLKARSSADGAAATQDLVSDERNFIDLAECSIRFYREACTIDGAPGSGAHKIILGVSIDDAASLPTLEGRMATLLGNGFPGVVRAVQNVGLDTPANDRLRAPRNNDRDAYDYALELWFRDYASLSHGVLNAEGIMTRIVGLLGALPCRHRAVAWIAQERLMIGGDDQMAAAA